jgi:hypothetical protein
MYQLMNVLPVQTDPDQLIEGAGLAEGIGGA